MGLFSKDEPVRASVGDRDLQCLICGCGDFWQRQVKLNTTGMELFDLAWANKSALGLVCAQCGYLHEFVGDQVRLWRER